MGDHMRIMQQRLEKLERQRRGADRGRLAPADRVFEQVLRFERVRGVRVFQANGIFPCFGNRVRQREKEF